MSRNKILVGALFVVCATSIVQCSSGGGGGSPTAPPPPQTIIISIVDNAFSPQSPVITAGQTVRWEMNGMNAGHRTTEMEGTWDSGFVFDAQGDFFERTFPTSEDGQTFEYFCITHQASDAMQGSIRVGQSASDPRDGY